MGGDDDQVLGGGIANAGAVVRRGGLVLRPAGPQTPLVHRHLEALRAAGFRGAPEPRGLGGDGRERLAFVPGDVAVPPYPPWAQSEAALVSIARLVAEMHQVAAGVGAPTGPWNRDMADPEGGPMVCHDDICLENVVFRDGDAVALIDFDLAAPGRALWELAQLARMCVPLDDDVTAAARGWAPADRPARLRALCDAYGLGADDRGRLLGVIDLSMHRAAAFVRRRVAAGDVAFAEALRALGGEDRFRRRDDWWRRARESCARAVA